MKSSLDNMIDGQHSSVRHKQGQIVLHSLTSPLSRSLDLLLYIQNSRYSFFITKLSINITSTYMGVGKNRQIEVYCSRLLI